MGPGSFEPAPKIYYRTCVSLATVMDVLTRDKEWEPGMGIIWQSEGMNLLP